MPDPRYGLFCCICFVGMKPEDCYVDEYGDAWDFHREECAEKAGYHAV